VIDYDCVNQLKLGAHEKDQACYERKWVSGYFSTDFICDQAPSMSVFFGNHQCHGQTNQVLYKFCCQMPKFDPCGAWVPQTEAPTTGQATYCMSIFWSLRWSTSSEMVGNHVILETTRHQIATNLIVISYVLSLLAIESEILQNCFPTGTGINWFQILNLHRSILHYHYIDKSTVWRTYYIILHLYSIYTWTDIPYIQKGKPKIFFRYPCCLHVYLYIYIQ
jgi:hypothetical protein